MAIQNNKYHPIPIFTKCQRILLFVYVYTSIYLDFLRLYFGECRWRVCLGRCVRSYVLLIGGSNPAMARVFFSKIFPKIVFIQYLLVRLGLEFGSGLFFNCGI